MARRIGTIMVDMGYLDEDSLWKILEEQNRSGNELLGKIAVRMGLAKEEQVLKALGEQLGMKVIKLNDITIPAEMTELVGESMATAYKVVPLSQNKKDKSVTVVMAEPQNPSTIDSLRLFLGVDVKGAVASEADVMAAIERLYARHHESIQDVVKQIEQDKGLAQLANRNPNTIDLEAIEEMSEAAPVRKLLNMVLLLAIKDKASDIHFEPFEEEYKMRYRVDGILYELVPPPRHLAPAIASRIKVMANLDIAERRLPQDGKIQLALGSNSVDIRVSTLPTMFGESVVLRILDRSVVQLDLRKLGMPEDTLAQWMEVIRKPNGIVLVTGPTSSGKTTTLYATLNELNKIEDKIITTEEPVEYEVEGLIQVPINPEIGVTFASCLRSILRQDPDKILVGRDPRPGDGRDLDPGVAHRAHGLHHAAHQRRALGGHPAARHGPAHLPHHGHRRSRAGPAPGAEDLQLLPDRVYPQPGSHHGAGADRRAGRRPEMVLRQGLRQVQQHRLQGPHGNLRAGPHER